MSHSNAYFAPPKFRCGPLTNGGPRGVSFSAVPTQDQGNWCLGVPGVSAVTTLAGGERSYFVLKDARARGHSFCFKKRTQSQASQTNKGGVALLLPWDRDALPAQRPHVQFRTPVPGRLATLRIGSAD
eukprot:474643-Pyramimonas_sp.AAC.1